AIVVIFGLMVSTLLTLVVVPTLYVLMESIQIRLGDLKRRYQRWYWAPYRTLAEHGNE
ncbi:MAG: efflux RND transporter permease subunit, partial [Desulfatitalea sp.]|nr:efflux RND transporter permease subunit [Desulfatitalea sp.]